MSTLEYILLFTFVGSILGLTGGIILLIKERFIQRISHLLASFAAGVLLATAFFDLLPEALEDNPKGIDIFLWTLVGILVFLVMERFIHWFHSHHQDYESSGEKTSKNTVPLIIISDTVHNFLDGVVIAATLLVNVQLGLVTAFAIMMHELPQEIGDFGLLIHKGMSRKRVIIANIISAAASFVGAIGAYIIGGFIEAYIPVFLALTAGFFIYIALSDIMPEVYFEKRHGFAAFESILLVLGVMIIWLSVNFIPE